MFDWLASLFDTLVSFVPRFTIVRATHAGVKWPRGGAPVELKPGLRWYWPLVTEVEVIVAARQTNLLQPQSMTLRDGTQWTVRGVCVFFVNDVVAAIGEKNWDVDTTVDDLCRAAIFRVVSRCSRENIHDVSRLNEAVTEKARKSLRMFGVRVHSCELVESTQARAYRLISDGAEAV